mgnify:CR=1 FL=1
MVKQDHNFSELVQEARRGCRYSVNKLAVAAQPRMMAFFLRTALQPELAEDLTQETLLTMLGQIERLEKADSFWPWLYRVAWSKLQQHFRRRHAQATVSISELGDGWLEPQVHRPDALQLLMHREAVHTLRHALGTGPG